MDWLTENWEWFVGVIATVVVGGLGLIFSKRHADRVQRQKGGRGSTNVQVGGDLTVTKGRQDDE